MEQVSIRGIASNQKVAKVSIVKVPDRPGIAAKLFSEIGRAGINIHLIVQAQSHAGTNDITFIVSQDSLHYLTPLLDEAVASVGGDQALVDDQVGTVSVVG